MDNLANLFSKIQNGQNLHKIFVRVPFSKKSWNICTILFIEGLLKGFFFKENFIYIFLKYAQNEPVIKRIEKLSLQGRRLYTKKGLNRFAKRSVMIGLERSTDGVVGLVASHPNHANDSIDRIVSLDWIGSQSDSNQTNAVDRDLSIRTNASIPEKSRSTDGLNGLVASHPNQTNQPLHGIDGVDLQRQSIQPSLVNTIKNLQFFKLRILSTSKGIMSERDSKFLGIGGEILCDIY